MNAFHDDNTSTRRGSNDRPPPARRSRASLASPRATTSESDPIPPAREHDGADVVDRERFPPRRANADVEIDAGSDEMMIELGSDDNDEGPMAHMRQTRTPRHQDQDQVQTRTNESDSLPPAREHHGDDVAGRGRSPPRHAGASAENEDESEEMKVELGSDGEDEGPMASVEQMQAANYQDQEPKGWVEEIEGGETPRSDDYAALMHEADKVDDRENAAGNNPPQVTAHHLTAAAQPMSRGQRPSAAASSRAPMPPPSLSQRTPSRPRQADGARSFQRTPRRPRQADGGREDASGQPIGAAQLTSPGQHPSTAAPARAPMPPPSPSQRTPSRPQQAVGVHEAALGRDNRGQPATPTGTSPRVPTPSSRPTHLSRTAQGVNNQGGRNTSSAGSQLQQQPIQTTAPAPNSVVSPPSDDDENTQPPPTLEATLVQSAEATLIDPNHDAGAPNNVQLYEATRISNVERYKFTIIVGLAALVIGALVSAVVMLAGRGSDGTGGDQQTLLTTPATPPPIFIISARPTPQPGMSPIGPETLSIMPSKDPSFSIESSATGGDRSSTSSDPSGVPSPRPSAAPTQKPTALPPNQKPTLSPSVPTLWPSLRPSIRPTDGPVPSTVAPTQKPTALPITQKPTLSPLVPTPRPSLRPSVRLTDGPVQSTVAPTRKPTPLPTTQKPTVSPSVRTPRPSLRPSVRPTKRPVPITVAPTPKPSLNPMTELQSSALELVPKDKILSHGSNKNVAIHGNTAVVGAPYNDNKKGFVLVYVKDDNGNWLQQAKLVAPDGTAGDRFGWSVGIHGDTIIVGADEDDDNGNDSGSAHVFVRDGVTWTHLAKLVAPDGAADDFFGFSVGIYDDTLIVGAYGDDDNGDRSGSVHLFVRNGNAWTHQAKLVAPDGAADYRFGYSVGIFGDTAVIGAYGDDDNGDHSGSAYLFVLNNDAWTYQAKLLAPDGAAIDKFGISAAIFGDTIVVGAYGDDDKGTNSGSAYLFARINDTWTYQAKLVAPDGAADDRFGLSVAIHGDVVIVGSCRDDDIGEDSGSAHAFVRNGAAWTHHAKLLAPRTGEWFGRSVGIYDGTIISGSKSGEAYVFSG